MADSEFSVLENRDELERANLELNLILALIRNCCELEDGINLEKDDSEGLYLILKRIQKNLQWASTYIDNLSGKATAPT